MFGNLLNTQSLTCPLFAGLKIILVSLNFLFSPVLRVTSCACAKNYDQPASLKGDAVERLGTGSDRSVGTGRRELWERGWRKALLGLALGNIG